MAKGLKVSKKRLPKGKSEKREKRVMVTLACECGTVLAVTNTVVEVECSTCLMKGMKV